MWAILLIGRCFSRASRRCSSCNLLLGSFNMVDLRLWNALSRWHSSWRVHTPPICIPIFWTEHINSCMFMINYDRYIIKRHVSHAWYGCWTIKALAEAEVLWWHYSDLRGHSSSVDHCQTSEVQNKMIFMGHQISSCHVPVVRSFFILCKMLLSSRNLPCDHLLICTNIAFQYPKKILSHNSSCFVPISTSPVPKSHIVMSHN